MKSKRISSPGRSNLKPVVSFVAVLGLALFHGLPAAANPIGETLTLASVQHSGPPVPRAVDLRGAYESNRITGIVMAGILAPVFGGITAMGTTLLYRHGREDNGGFCTVIARESDGDYRRTCEGDRGELAGIILVSSVGGILTLAMLVSGVIKLSRSSRRLRRLSLDGAEPELRPLEFRFAMSEREVALGFAF